MPFHPYPLLTGRPSTLPTPAYLKDSPHCGSYYQRQDVDRIRHREILEPPEPTCLEAGHRQVGHLSQSNEEGEEDGGLSVRIKQSASTPNRRYVITKSHACHHHLFLWGSGDMGNRRQLDGFRMN